MANTKGNSVISNPQGGGAQSGLGEKFSPDLFTGTGNFSVPIAVPPGRNGFQPDLALGYSSGNGNGIFGMGWAIGIPGITRKTSKGIPIYNDRTDIFILSGAEDLVPVQYFKDISGGITHEKTLYQPRTEGLFARIIRHKKSNGEHYWEVRSKDGLISWYGTPGAITGNDPAVVANPDLRASIYAWQLTKTEDPFGNVILYEYERELVTSSQAKTTPHVYDQLYLKTIRYAQYPTGPLPTDIDFMCKVNFLYEDRPDPFSGYKQGFEIRTTKRCTALEMYTNAITEIKTKTYHFNYPTNLPLNGATLLDSVSVEGHNGPESEFMPPLQFSYSVFEPKNRNLETISGPIPQGTLADVGYELVDVTGNGLPDILQLGAGARYWTNKGNGQFGPSKEMSIAPSVAFGTSSKSDSAGVSGVSFIDANGDGRTDLLVMNGVVSGYFPGAFHKVWDNNGFRPFTQIPSFNLEDPEVKLIDLDGDGITDVLRNGSRFECFFNDPEKGFNKIRVVDKTFPNFSFADPRIRFADMTGDGLQDIVLLSSGRVQYWPNLGYGRFGKMVNMKNAPVFPEQFNPSQVLIGDLDGDGQSDIAFIDGNSVTLSINQAGNTFSDPVKILNTPFAVNPSGLRIADIKGTGQAGILWSFGPNANTGPGKMYFLDFTKGNKPYVLEQMDNNMGGITRISYGSSVYHYLRDETRSETKWKTDLPFPVQVVNRVEVLDLLSGGKLVTEYNYHNGYWDGVEREFRGFAHVDSFDTETFTEYNTQDLFANSQTEFGVSVNSVSPEHYTPPTMTKSWFYVGPVGEGYSRWQEPDFSSEYWSGDQQILPRENSTKSLLASMPRWAQREALRTFRGTLLRSELYALDSSNLRDKPYTITESLMNFDLKFPAINEISKSPNTIDWSIIANNGQQSTSHCVFFPFNIAQRTTQYERGTDPMHNFNFTKEYDNYGQPQGQLSLGVPRNFSPASGAPLYTGPDNTPPINYLATYSLSEFIYVDNILVTEQYMVNRVKRSLNWDLTQSCINMSIFDVRNNIFGQYTTNPLTINFPIISCVLNFYDGTAFIGLPYGSVGTTGAQVRSETLVITDAIIGSAYGINTPQCFVNVPDWTTGYPSAFAGLLQNGDTRLGYLDRRTGYPNHALGWYAESSRVKYDFQVGSPFYGLILENKDVFDNLNTITYDNYNILPIKSRQFLNGIDYLETVADYDYRVLQPYQAKDTNNNYSEFDFSPLGLLRAVALIGKGTEGDYKSGTGGYYNKYAPSVVLEYDFFAFKNYGNPVFVRTISREKHYQQQVNSPTITKVEYSDGFGRLLQTRVQAEDIIFGNQTFGSSGLSSNQTTQNSDAIGIQRGISDPLNVVVTGWKIYNNKGKIVEQYEPFFDTGFDFILPGLLGVKIKMFYDALGRVIKTKNPDNSEQWVIYGIPNALNIPSDPVLQNNTVQTTPWENFSYDANDLTAVTNPSNPSVPVTDYFTPKSAKVDALGRTVKTKEYFDNSNYNNVIEMNYFYDIRGNLLLVKDSYNRNVFENIYDLRVAKKNQPVPPIYTNHIDKGASTVLFDALAKPVESKDAKGSKTLSAFDRLQRLTHTWANNKTGDGITLRNYLIYGDSAGLPTPENNNLKGNLYNSYDEAGLLQMTEYDFKGNLLTKIRNVLNSTVLKTALSTFNNYIVDWTGLPSILDSTNYETDMQYDALNRTTELELPQDLDAERKKIIPTYNNAGALEKVDLYSPTGPTTTNYVEHIAYNAKGQRLLISFGNSMMTRYVYDNLTFRLLRYRTERYVKSQIGNTITYAYQSGTNKQDDAFNYDLIGNIVNIFTRVTDCGIGGNPDALDRTFSYDSIYRLLTADGRESNTQNGNNYLYNDAPIPSNPLPSNVRSYNRSYTYDKLGNILSVVQGGTNGFTRNYTYNAGKNSLQKIEDTTPATIESYTYDSCGNTLTTNLNRYYVWNHSDQLLCYYNDAGSGPTVFTQYDYAGEDRVSKLVRTGNNYERTIYIDGVFEFVKLETTSTTYTKNYIHITDDKSRIAEIRINPGTAFPGDISDDVVYILEDHIGSSVVRLTTSGTVVDEEEYYPFGDSSLRTFTYKRYRYVRKERDAESGLYYYGARYYAAWTCRFISVDPLAQKYANLSPYNYADNNPINDFDIDGMQNTNSTPTNTTGGNTTNTGTAQGSKPVLTSASTTNVTATYSPPVKSSPTVLDECSDNCQTVRGLIIGGTGGYNVDIPAGANTLTGQQSFPIAGKPDNKIDVTLAFSYTDDKGVLKMFQWSPEVNAFYGGNNEIYGGQGVARVSGYTSAAFGMPDYFANHPSSAEGKQFGNMQFAINATAAGVGVIQLGTVGVRMALNRFAATTAVESFESFVKMMTPINELDAVKTLYRGTTGSETKGSTLFLTDNPDVAATYVKNGGQVMQYQVSEFSLSALQMSGNLNLKTGIHGASKVISTEYMFSGKELIKALNSFAKPH